VTYLQLSPSKVSTWLDCPRRYFFAYVERRPSGRSWAHLSFGNSVHAALREWFALARSQRDPLRVTEIVSQQWIDAGFRDAEQSETWRRRAVEMVSAYVTSLDPGFEPVGSERTLAFKVDGFIMQGRIDRIDRVHESDDNDDRLSVIDYKTGKTVPTIEDVRGSSALAMYALMVQRTLGATCFDVALHHVPSGACVSWTHTDESLQRQVDRVAQIARDIVAAQDTRDSLDIADEQVLDDLFPARPGRVCGFCDYWEVCPAGQLASERQESWAGLSDSLDQAV
jgi:putative RecB family exonuclease